MVAFADGDRPVTKILSWPKPGLIPESVYLLYIVRNNLSQFTSPLYSFITLSNRDVSINDSTALAECSMTFSIVIISSLEKR